MARPNLPPTIVIPGPGPQEPAETDGANEALVSTGNTPETGAHISGVESLARSTSQESPTNENADDEDDDEHEHGAS